MANYSTTADVVLTVNGKQAQQQLKLCEQEAAKLQKKIEAAAKSGDKASMKKFQKELTSVNKTIDQLRGSAATTEQVLKRLDTATPKELNRTLRTLKQQLNGIQRGTAAWDAQIAKIRMVKAEIQKVNREMATQQSMWQRMNKWLNNAQTAIMGLAAAVTGLVMAGRKAVNSYAEMEEQLADTRKYTRMTAKEVEDLNEIFKNMDTRLAREQLNLLAQEGGRLGYNTVQSVKEYVEAASIINVALVDLGEGATQTIAKLTNIFGVEEAYGVKEAMLKVGSTVNHLSQNCTAAKPYLVDFAQRMAGIGSTAKMTIPEILAFAATLDAHGQKVEMSATALQRTIMELYKDTAGIAKKVGLDAKELTETLNKSTTEGVIKFLEAIKGIGEDKALAILSPLFKDLGLDGARVSGVLANLSSHLDFLKWQLGEATEAFREGSSASNEYAIFNNTVQASLDKAKKRVGELAVELGEKLYPLMRHIYTSSSTFLRVLNELISFIIEHRTAISNLVVVLGAYYSAVLLINVGLRAAAAAGAIYNTVIKAGTVLHNLWRASLLACKVVVLAFTNGIEAARTAMVMLNKTVRANPFGIITAVIAGLIILINKLVDSTSEYTKKLREAANISKIFNSELNREMNAIDQLFGRLEAAKRGTKEYKEAKDAIISQFGKYLSGLVNERNEILNLEKAYIRLEAAARAASRAGAIKAAKETANQTYGDALTSDAKLLQEHLEKNGFSKRDAVRITQRVVIDLQTKGTLSPDIVKELQSIKGNTWDKGGNTNHPVNIVNRMIRNTSDYKATMKDISSIERQLNFLQDYSESDLKKFVNEYSATVKQGKGGKVIIGMGGPNPEVIELSAADLRDYLEEAQALLSLKQSSTKEMVSGNPNFNINDFTPYESEKDRKKRQKEEEAARKKAEQEQKRAAIKAKKEFKDELNKTKGDWEADSAKNLSDHNQDLIDYIDFMNEKYKIDMKYFDDREKVYKKWKLEEDEDYQELINKKAEYEQAWLSKNASLQVDYAKRLQNAEEIQAQMDYYTKGSDIYQNEEALQKKLYNIRITYLQKIRDAYNKGSEEYHNYQVQIEDAIANEKLRKQKLYSEKIQEYREKYEYQSAAERLKLEKAIVQEMYKQGVITLKQRKVMEADLKKKYKDLYVPDSAKNPEVEDEKARKKNLELHKKIIKSLYDQGILSEKEYENALKNIEKNALESVIEKVRRFGSETTNQLLDIYEAFQDFFKKTEEDGGNWATKVADLAASVFAVMSFTMSQASSYMSAASDLAIAKEEKRYDREIELAEGNSYKVAKLEKEKEEKIAQMKEEASQKQFAMDVIAAISQTATNALLAYGAGLKVGGLAGLIIAPIAAAMAAAQGAIQIATIKKQQQLALVQGYSEGGFTPSGDKLKPVGVVHAGEWVASQELVNNPRIRPVLEALDYAQKNNRIGSLKLEDVSRSITAPFAANAISSSQAPQEINVIAAPDNETNEAMNELSVTIAALNQKLSQPFVTINTVTGKNGINSAMSKYQSLINNKSPKSYKNIIN